MKTHFLKILAIFFLAISLSLLSCKKEDNNPVGGNNPPALGTMTAKVDGQNWSSTNLPGYDGAFATYGSDALTITGTQITGTKTITIQILLFNVKSSGTYELGNPEFGDHGLANIAFADATDLSSQKAYGTTGEGEFKGVINLTNFEGTFSFTGTYDGAPPTDKKVITDGKFNVKINN